ncbi:phosphate ABC transporter membrane protein 1 (PhoT family) [Thermodesulfitimonas autotrophica]|uniref:Phosphate transport system permease protein n=1 Tax=Thermodesulfitimonas autotrophica TaxID=1894989 RepID=A0A3N5AP20_9THEO|nr:phosphate ABC transporter permease subunit PstC [Thermodesulfitimonas autotrophica]RPF46604.1 phosphate ABC transporter membrane protein 1 (PhoT family) [Thermodesulfitimonas autotrophica]
MVNRNVRREFLGYSLTFSCALIAILLTLAIILFLGWKGLAVFTQHKISLTNIFSVHWWPDRPAGAGGPQVGVLTFIFGSVITSTLAVLVSAPLGVTVAVFMAEISPRLGQRFLQPVIELLAGIPSVVYGYIGLSVLVPFIRNNIGGTGFSLLAGVMVLAVMILPTIASMATDAIRALPGTLKEAALALGATRWQAIRTVILPSARAGILMGVVLGLARAFGEALAVQMVIGNRREIPHSILDPLITLTSGITMDMGNTVQGSLWNDTLWFMALILLVLSFFFIFLIRLLGRKGAVH